MLSLAAVVVIGSIQALFSTSSDRADVRLSLWPGLAASDSSSWNAPPSPPPPPLPPVRRRNVAIATAFGFHFDVYMAFAKTLGDVMDALESDGGARAGTVNIFAPDFQLGFQDVTDELGLWKHRGVREAPEKLIEYLDADPGDGGIDLVVFGTCEVE